MPRRDREPPDRSAPVVIDDVDKAIVEALQEDGRLPYTKLAKQVGLSEAAVRQRVQRLIESGVMQIVVVSGSFDLLMEVVCEDDDHLLARLNYKVRTVAGVRSTESFTYLRLFKQSYAWGT